MPLIILGLDAPPPQSFINGPLHRIGYFVGVQQDGPIHIPGGPANSLDQGTLRAQIALFVRIQNGHQRDLGNIEPLAQEVDADQDIEAALAERANNFDALKRVDIRVEIAHPDADFLIVIGQVFSQPFGQGGGQHPLTFFSPQSDFFQQVVHLLPGRSDRNLGVQQAGGTNELFHNAAFALFAFIVAWCRRDVDRLAGAPLEFMKAEGTVIQGGGQPKAVLHQGGLARAVATVHAANLGDGDMAFIDEDQVVVRKIVEQRMGWFARLPAIQVARVILDARTKAHFAQEREIVQGALLQALAFEEFVFLLQLFEPLCQLLLDGLCGALQPTGGGDIVAGRINGDFIQPTQHLAPERVDLGNRINRIAKELDPYRPALLIGRKDLDHIAPDPKRATMKIKVVTLVLNIDQLAEQRVAVHLAALFDKEDEIKIRFGRPESIDTRDAGDDNRIAPL